MSPPLRRPDPEVVAWLDRINPRQVWLPSVVVFELRYGACPSPIDHRNNPGAHRLVDLRDTLIAGIALAHEAQLATRNVRHFTDTTISLINPFSTYTHYG